MCVPQVMQSETGEAVASRETRECRRETVGNDRTAVKRHAHEVLGVFQLFPKASDAASSRLRSSFSALAVKGGIVMARTPRFDLPAS